MKHLYILRHAKSSWDDAAMSDFDRPLNGRGLRTAPFMGELMAGRGVAPELILSSPAERARQTAEMVKESAGMNAPIRFDERIYEASLQTLVYLISGIEDTTGSVLLVGHNPGCENLVRFLTGRVESMPTAALASIRIGNEEWADVSEGTGELEFLIRPKEALVGRDGAEELTVL